MKIEKCLKENKDLLDEKNHVEKDLKQLGDEFQKYMEK